MILSQFDIEKRIQHRFENQLLDEAGFLNETGEGHLHLCIQEKDSRNRHLFLKQKKRNGIKSIIPSVLMEILAIGSIVTSGSLKNDEAVFFASIMDFEKGCDALANTPINGTTSKISEKAQFLKYKGTLYQDDKMVGTGSMMAFFLESSKQEDVGVSKKGIIPNLSQAIPVSKKNQYKTEEMMLCDELSLCTDHEAVGVYTFPETHPTTKGHFPGNPVMMGVMQWMTLEDTLLAWAKKRNYQGKIKGDATLLKTDGTLVAEVKNFQADIWMNDENYMDQAEIHKLQKITFRSMVKPQETLLIHLFHLEQQS